jgi:NADH-quinone oxidoreductase subunit J
LSSIAISTLLGGGFVLSGAYHTTTSVGMSLAPLLFLTLVPTVTLFFTAGAIFLKSAVHNLLCLIGAFINAVLFYLYVGAEFLALTFLIVYVGAIAILFLFVIMLLLLKEVVARHPLLAAGLLGAAATLYPIVITGIDDFVSEAVSTFITYRDLFLSSVDSTAVEALLHYIGNRHTDILLFSESLYTRDSLLFFIAALLLLTAMLGAIILATCATDTADNY